VFANTRCEHIGMLCKRMQTYSKKICKWHLHSILALLPNLSGELLWGLQNNELSFIAVW
jgi:hypothetical protein